LINKIYQGAGDEGGGDDDEDEGGGSGASASLALKFKDKIESLMNTLSECNCHFVRCMKPHPLQFDRPNHYFPGYMIN